MNSKPNTQITIQNLENEGLEALSDNDSKKISGGTGSLTQDQIKAMNMQQEMYSNLMWKSAQTQKKIISSI